MNQKIMQEFKDELTKEAFVTEFLKTLNTLRESGAVAGSIGKAWSGVTGAMAAKQGLGKAVGELGSSIAGKALARPVVAGAIGGAAIGGIHGAMSDNGTMAGGALKGGLMGAGIGGATGSAIKNAPNWMQGWEATRNAARLARQSNQLSLGL